MRKKVLAFTFATGMLVAIALPFVGTGGAAAAKPDCSGAGTPGQVVKYYAQLDGNGVGDAVGGVGNSDGNATNGQAHSDPGRGAQNQAFLATCGVGSQ